MLADELELPSAPEATQEASFNTSIDASIFGDVPGLNEPIPAGTKHFRLDKYTKKEVEGQPRFDVQWKCQEEPNVGRVLFDFVPWVNDETLKAAGDPSNVYHQEAKAVIRKRLPRAKEIMAAAGFKPSGSFDFEADFLSTNPEVKIPVTISERKNKDTREFLDNGAKNPDFGKYTIATGTLQNGIPNTYLSINRPG